MADDRVNIIVTFKDFASRGFSRLQAQIITLNQALILLQTAARLAAAPFVFFERQVLRTTDAFRRSEIALVNFTGSLVTARGQMARLQDMAKQMPFQLLDLQKAFVRLKSTGIEETERVIRATADAVSAFGGNTQDLQLSILALQQMMGKGVVSMEELRRQLGERIPTAIKIMAREMGLTLPELFKAVESGSVRSAEAIKALVRGFEKDFPGAAKAMMNTWTGATSNMSDAWSQMMRAIGDTGLYDAAVDGLQNVTRGIEDATKKTGFWSNAFTRLRINIKRAQLEVLKWKERVRSAWTDKQLDQITKWVTKIAELEAEIRGMDDPLMGLATAIENIGKKADKTSDAITKFFDAIQKRKKIDFSFDDPSGAGVGMEAFILEMAKAAGAARAMREEFEFVDATIQTMVVNAARNFEELTVSEEFMKEALENYRKELEAVASIKLTNFDFEGIDKAIEDAITRLIKLQRETKTWGDLLLGIVSKFGKVGAAIASAVAAYKAFGGGIQGGIAALADVALNVGLGATSEQLAAINRLAEAIEQLNAETERQIAVIRDQIASGAISREAGNRAISQIRANGESQLERLEAQLEQAREESQVTNRALNNLFQSLTDAFAPVLEELAPAINLLAEGIGILSALIRQLIEAMKSAGRFTQGLIDSVRKPLGFQEGGVLTSDRMMRFPGMAAGEGLFKGHVGETVIPIGGSGGGINITINGNVDDSVVDRMVRILEERNALGRLNLA